MLYHRLAEPFSDTCFCTYRVAWQVRANLGYHASGCFSWTYIFSNVLVTGFYTYPEHTPKEASGTISGQIGEDNEDHLVVRAVAIKGLSVQELWLVSVDELDHL